MQWCGGGVPIGGGGVAVGSVGGGGGGAKHPRKNYIDPEEYCGNFTVHTTVVPNVKL